MPTPTPAWNLVRVIGTWNNMDGSKKAGSYKVSNSSRITSATDDVMIPAGVFATGNLSVAASQPSLDVMVPAVNDPDITPANTTWTIEVSFNDKTPSEIFNIKPLVGTATFNLRQVVLPSSAPAPSDLQYVGVAGGLARLDADGDVIKADGSKVTGSGGGGPVTASAITDATATGRNVLKAADALAARTAIGAGTSSLALGTTNITAKAGNYAPAAADISDATATGRNVLKATDATAARTAISAASATQGTKADAAVPAADLQDLVEDFLDLGVRVDQTLAYNDPALNTKLAALPVGTVVGIVGPEVA